MPAGWQGLGPWDKVDDYPALAAYAREQGIAIGTVNANVFQDDDYRLGSVAVQARALGAGPRDLDGMRALIRATQPLRRFEPAGDPRAWAAAAQRI